jgi:hypothetical protein
MTINHNQFAAFWHGHIVELDEEQNIKQTGFGGRYRVRRIGIDDPTADPKDLSFFYYTNPVTAGSGDGEAGSSTNLKPGDMVWGLHTDYPRNQRGFIVGVYPRSVMTQYGGDVTTSDIKTASGGAQEGDQTLPSYRNLGPKDLENRNGKPKKRVVEGDPGVLPTNTIDKGQAVRNALGYLPT